uniref:Uncharacterized protein n=1 Tax=Nesodiprion zhejiangensis nucleopolyhedrovirus TaxID=3135970 RepID=A0AAN0LI93_9BACU
MGSNYQLGSNDNLDIYLPLVLSDSIDKKIIAVDCGGQHSAMIAQRIKASARYHSS